MSQVELGKSSSDKTRRKRKEHPCTDAEARSEGKEKREEKKQEKKIPSRISSAVTPDINDVLGLTHPDIAAFLRTSFPVQIRSEIRNICQNYVVSVPLRLEACRFLVQSYQKASATISDLERKGTRYQLEIAMTLTMGLAGPFTRQHVGIVTRERMGDQRAVDEKSLQEMQDWFDQDMVRFCISIVVGQGIAGFGNTMYTDNHTPSDEEVALQREYTKRVRQITASARARGLLYDFNHVGRGECGDGLTFDPRPLIT